MKFKFILTMSLVGLKSGIEADFYNVAVISARNRQNDERAFQGVYEDLEKLEVFESVPEYVRYKAIKKALKEELGYLPRIIIHNDWIDRKLMSAIKKAVGGADSLCPYDTTFNRVISELRGGISYDTYVDRIDFIHETVSFELSEREPNWPVGFEESRFDSAPQKSRRA